MIDLIHVLEYIWKAAWCLHPAGDAAAEDWVAVKALAVGPRRLEAVLTLRAVISNGDFDDYWRFHLAREHQRLYPGTAQGQYALGA